jgi:hypothetical protein
MTKKSFNLRNVFAVTICLAVTTMFSGCGIFKSISSSNTAFYLAYDSDEIIRDSEKVATILSIYDFAIDDVNVTPQNMRSSVHSRGGKSLAVDVMPGKYTLKLTTNVDESGNIIVSNVPVTRNFEAGKIYEVGLIKAPFGVYTTIISEKKSANVAEKIATLRNNSLFEKR